MEKVVSVWVGAKEGTNEGGKVVHVKGWVNRSAGKWIGGFWGCWCHGAAWELIGRCSIVFSTCLVVSAWFRRCFGADAGQGQSSRGLKLSNIDNA